MKYLVMAAAVSVVLTMNGIAQITSVREKQPYVWSSGATPFTGTGQAVWREVVENIGTSAITAFHAKFRCTGSAIVGGFKKIDYDTVHDPLYAFGADREIPAGGSIEIQAADPSQCEGGVDAVLFADGHSEGNPEEIKNIYLTRQGINQALIFIQGQLDKSSSENLTTKTMINNLNNYMSAAVVDHSLSTAKKAGMAFAIGAVRSMLEHQANWGVPSEYTAQRKPRVEQIMSSRGVTHDQAYAIVTSMKVQEWRAALEGNLEPSAPM